MDTQQKKRLVLIVSLFLLCFVVVPVIIFLVISSLNSSYQPTEKTVIIDNRGSYSSGVDQSTFASIGTSTYVVVTLNVDTPENVYHGLIRDNSFEKTKNKISFVLDIPTAQMSWAIHQTINDKGIGVSDPLISCIDEERAIYPILESCVDRDNGSVKNQTTEQKKFFEVLKDLPLSAPTFHITYTNSSTKPGNYALLVTHYSEAGKQDALDALKSLGYNPDDYEIVYQLGISPQPRAGSGGHLD